MIPRLVPPLVLLLSLASRLAAQDTRTVSEPFFPQLCTTLDSQLQSVGRSLSPPDEQKLDTARIQKAIDKCGKGRAVLLHVNETNDAFLSGPLQLKPEITLILGTGVTLFASRDAALYAVSPGSCGVVSHSEPRGCKPLISVDRASRSAIMGDGAIDGRGGEKMLGSQYSWWDLAGQARAGGEPQVPSLIVADYSDNFTLYRITLRNSPNSHLAFSHGNGFTAWGLRIDAPQLARNSGGIDLGDGSKNITIMQSYIRTGGDSVSINSGPGSVTNVTVSHNHFYWGHGISVGGETTGAMNRIRVFDLSLDGAGDGIRIRSNGGSIQDVAYDDICIRNSPHPIAFDAANSAAATPLGNSPPSTTGIALRNVRISGGGKFTFDGDTHDERIDATLDGVQITDDARYAYDLKHADLALGPGPTNLRLPSGSDATGHVSTGNDSTRNDSTITGTPAEGNPPSCAEKFVPFPQ